MMKKFALAGVIFCAVTSQQVLGMNLGSEISKAIDENDLNELMNLIKQSGNEIDHFYTGVTALHRAVFTNKPDIINALVAKDANVGSKTETMGRTALHLAITMKNLGILETLLGSTTATKDVINAQDGEGETALSLAAQAGFLDGIKK